MGRWRAAGLLLIGQGCFIELPDEITPRDAATQAYRDEVLADGPRAYWRFAEQEGPVALDETSMLAGQYEGTPTLGVPGLVGQTDDRAVLFDGDDEMLVP